MSTFQNFMKILLQILLIGLFWLLGDFLVKVFHISIPASILAIFLLSVCLFSKLLPLKYIEQGADAILKDLIFLFLPIMVTVIQYKTLFLTEGWKLFVSILFGTALVMLSTSIAIHLLYKLQKILKREKTI